MQKVTCSEPGCREKRYALGLCKRHYGIAYRRGNLPPKQLLLGVHYLSNVDRDALTADCAVCGSKAPIRLRVNDGRIEAQCLTKVIAGKAETERRYAAKGKRKRTKRWDHLHQKYRVTRDDYDRMFAEQQGRCAICRTAHDILNVDHDHATGAVRGLLCKNCNIALGWLKDDAGVASEAARYLSLHETS